MIQRFARVASVVGCLLFSARGAHARLFQDSDLLVVDSLNANGSGILYDVNPATGQRFAISSGGLLHQPSGMCFDASGNIVIADAGHGAGDPGSLIRIDPNTGAQTHITTSIPLSHPAGVALESSGNLIVTQEGGAASALLRVNVATGQTDIIHSGSPFTVSTTTAIDHNGDYIVSSINGGGSITRVDHVTGAATLIAQPPVDGPIGIIIDRADPNRALLAIRAFAGPSFSGLSWLDLTSGAVTPLSLGNHLALPSDLAEDGQGHIYMTNDDSLSSPSGEVYRIDPVTGGQTLIAGSFVTPRGIIAVPEPSALGAVALAGFAMLRRRRQSIAAPKSFSLA